jgi:hypothetical protein
MGDTDPHRVWSVIELLFNPPEAISTVIRQAMYNHNGGEKAIIKTTICPMRLSGFAYELHLQTLRRWAFESQFSIWKLPIHRPSKKMSLTGVKKVVRGLSTIWKRVT